MEFDSFIGVDVSKNTLDLCVLGKEAEMRLYKIANRQRSLEDLFNELQEALDLTTTLICAEYTGHYSNVLRDFCLSRGWSLWLENGAEIKFRSGVQRGKDDAMDAHRIARYAHRFQDKAKLLKVTSESLQELQLLICERELYIKEQAKYKMQLKDLKGYIQTDHFKTRKLRLIRHLKCLQTSIAEIDQRIEELFEKDQVLAKQLKILESIDGVGRQVAINTIVETNAFTKFSSARKFACHIGVAPFSFKSGTSQRSRNKVSHRADKRLKTLFHMAALSAIRMEGEFQDYFLRKVAEGKNKMSVINAVRAKLIQRIFALIRDERPYQKKYQIALVKP